jgi:hypothetical protein
MEKPRDSSALLCTIAYGKMKIITFAVPLSSFVAAAGFLSSGMTAQTSFRVQKHRRFASPNLLVLKEKISKKRRDQLGIGEGEDEYDLDVALTINTDPLISKIIAGSFILVMVSLLLVGVVLPSLTDYGEGVCNPILSAGRC